jgi:hypothetical protein
MIIKNTFNYYAQSMFNRMCNIKEIKDLENKKGNYMLLYYMTNFNIFNTNHNGIYYIQYQSNKKIFKTILKKTYILNIKNILLHIENDELSEYNFLNITHDDDVIIKNITIINNDKIHEIYDFIKDFVIYNSEITIDDILKIKNIEINDNIQIHLTYYKDYEEHVKILYCHKILNENIKDLYNINI